MPDDDPTNDDGLPNLEGLAASGSVDDLLLGIELRLGEGPPVGERRELMLRAARICATELEAPERARGWLERFRAPAPQVAIQDKDFRVLCFELDAEDLLQLPTPEGGAREAGADSGARGAPGLEESPGPQTLTLRLPTWRPFWATALTNIAIFTVIGGAMAVLLALTNDDGGSWGVPTWLLVLYTLCVGGAAGQAYYRYLWPANQRVIELGAEELVIRDGKGAALHREPRDQLQPDLWFHISIWGNEPVLQLVGVGMSPLTMSCRDEGIRPVTTTTDDMGKPQYMLDLETWHRLLDVLGLDAE